MPFGLEQAEAVLKKAARRGASAADLFFSEGTSFSAQVRLREVEKTSSAKSKGLGLRIFFGKRAAVVSTSDLDDPALDQLVEDACALARCVEEDPFSGLPDAAAYATDFPALDLVDPEIGGLSIEEKIDLARQAEQAAFDSDSRITNSEGADFGHTENRILYATSAGFAQTYSTSALSLSVSPIAASDGQMQRDYWYTMSRKYRGLQTPLSVGRTSAQRALRRLGARKVATQQVPVVFDPETAASLLEHLASALSGYAIYKKASFLADRLGAQIAAPSITLYDDPTLPSGLGSRPFDGEGLPARKKSVIENGVLKSYLLDTYSGRKLGLPSTGNAVRGTAGPPSVGVSNFYLSAGAYTPDEIIASVRTGLYVTELIGFGVNTVTGDYSRGACGLWIDNGALTYPVEEITLAGNLREMFQQIEMVGNDLDLTRAIAAPTLKINGLTLAGNERLP